MKAPLILAALLGLAIGHVVKGDDCKCGKRDMSMLMPYLRSGKDSLDVACELGMFFHLFIDNIFLAFYILISVQDTPGRCEWNAKDARQSFIQFRTIENDNFQGYSQNYP